ncbi:hypothetical protein QCA50_003298 [Cerrena zonata]|uniref:Uncharacterized protein n=1 Tax=Cerrena zonata TaxID=2478898 RepID=A0AAW0GJY6_9APHY
MVNDLYPDFPLAEKLAERTFRHSRIGRPTPTLLEVIETLGHQAQYSITLYGVPYGSGQIDVDGRSFRVDYYLGAILGPGSEWDIIVLHCYPKPRSKTRRS